MRSPIRCLQGLLEIAPWHIAHGGGGGGCLLEGMGLPMAHVWMAEAETLWECDTDTWQGNASVTGPFNGSVSLLGTASSPASLPATPPLTYPRARSVKPVRL